MMEKRGASPNISKNQMQIKRQYFERIKFLTQAGKHLEAQALYEQLIGRRSADSTITSA